MNTAESFGLPDRVIRLRVAVNMGSILAAESLGRMGPQ